MSGFFGDYLFVHTHIEKTAGSTLVRGFSHAFGQNRVYDLRPRKLTKPEFLSENDKNAIYVLTGHFHYGVHDLFFDRAKLYVACVRPPLDRFRSYYNYVKVRPNHPGYPSMVGKSFGQVVDELLRSREPRVNTMTRALTGQRDVAHDAVIAHLERNYLLVSPHSRVNETLNALVHISGGPPSGKELYANKGNSEAPEDIGELEAQFDRANACDSMVYQYVSERYDAWLQELDARLEAKAVFAPLPSRRTASAEATDVATPALVSGDEPSLDLRAWVEQNGLVPLAWPSTTAAAPDPNLRDALSPLIVSAIAGLPVQHRNFDEGDVRLVGAGTIGQFQRGGSVHFWGTAMGAAAILGKKDPYVRPAGTAFNIHAVRGPYSAEALRRQGIKVPDVYGEPLLLLPKIVASAEVSKRWKLGVVVEMPELQGNLADAVLDETLLRYVIPPSLRSSICIINTHTSRNVQALFDKVDEIRKCERIASLAPLGLIVAEAFRIPCVWFAKFSCGPAKARLDKDRIDPRVRDFYTGLGRQELAYYGNAPAQSTRWEEVMRAIDDSWTPIDSALRPLFDAFPLCKAVAFDDERWPLQPDVVNAIRL